MDGSPWIRGMTVHWMGVGIKRFKDPFWLWAHFSVTPKSSKIHVLFAICSAWVPCLHIANEYCLAWTIHWMTWKLKPLSCNSSRICLGTWMEISMVFQGPLDKPLVLGKCKAPLSIVKCLSLIFWKCGISWLKEFIVAPNDLMLIKSNLMVYISSSFY